MNANTCKEKTHLGQRRFDVVRVKLSLHWIAMWWHTGTESNLLVYVWFPRTSIVSATIVRCRLLWRPGIRLWRIRPIAIWWVGCGTLRYRGRSSFWTAGGGLSGKRLKRFFSRTLGGQWNHTDPLLVRRGCRTLLWIVLRFAQVWRGVRVITRRERIGWTGGTFGAGTREQIRSCMRMRRRTWRGWPRVGKRIIVTERFVYGR